MRRRALLAGLLLAGAASAQRAELPIREVDLSDGTRRYAVTLQIDGQSVDAGLDTGSTGLRVLPRALTSASVAASGHAERYFYGSGTQFEGRAIRVPVGAGAVSGPVTIMRIDTVECHESRACPAAHVDPANFGIQGNGHTGEGFAAILGVRLKQDAIENPFVQLGARRWIIDLPRSGETGGRIILNPPDADLAGYQRVRVDEDGTTAGCLIGANKAERVCGRAFFDSGAPGLRVMSATVFRPWPNGTPATIAIGDGDAIASTTVEIGRREQASGLFYEPKPQLRDVRLSLGLAPYFRWSVLYDADKHEIGLKPR